MKKFIAYFMVCMTVITCLGLYPQRVQAQRQVNSGPYKPLPLGTVKADGWLLKQLELQRDGATGNAEALYSGKDNLGSWSDWLGKWGNSWERVPYYVKGLVSLAYTLDDEGLKTKAQKWIDWSLNSQQANGYFGPSGNNDWWARMPMLYAIRDYYDATGDERVIPFFKKYFRYQLDNLPSRPLNSWGRSRAGDNMDVVLWLYEKTGDDYLLDLVEVLHDQAYDWTTIFTEKTFQRFGTDFQPRHNVNIPQAMKMPAIYYQLSQNQADKDAFTVGRDILMRDHGQAIGMQAGHEMLASKSVMSGLEACSIVEQMQTNERVQMILGDPSIGDQLERVAFNGLTALWSEDNKNHQYYTVMDQVMAKVQYHNHDQDYSNGLVKSPYSGCPCCRYNIHMGWPYYVKNMWAATRDGGLAVMAYGPNHVTTTVADNKEVTFTEVTNYPFEDEIGLTYSGENNITFPLELRIPGWANNPVVKVNGEVQTGVEAGSFYRISRVWQDGDQVTLTFPMELALEEGINRAVTVVRGPLVYALDIGENRTVKSNYSVPGFTEYGMTATKPWNYGLIVDKEQLNTSLEVVMEEAGDLPFTRQTSPIKILAQGKQVPEWTLGLNGMDVLEPPMGPVTSQEATKELTLLPMGALNLRVATLPLIKTEAMSGPVIYRDTFSDDFNSGLFGDWVYYNDGFAMYQGKAVSNTTEGNNKGVKMVNYATEFDNFTYEVDIKPEGTGDAGVLFRASKAALGTDTYEGYYVGINKTSNEVVMGSSNGRWSFIDKASIEATSDGVYHLKVEALGNQIKVYVEDMNNPKLTVEDSRYTKGYIGLRSYKCPAQWDNVSVAKKVVEPNVFRDDFLDGNTDEWTTYGGSWSIVNGSYKVGADPGAKSLINGVTVQNFNMEVEVNIGEVGNAGVIFRATNPSVGTDAFNGYYVGLNAEFNKIEVGKMDGGYTELAAPTVDLASDYWHHLRVEMWGDEIRVYLNLEEVPRVKIQDSTYTSGGVGVRTYKAEVSFDNMQVMY